MDTSMLFDAAGLDREKRADRLAFADGNDVLDVDFYRRFYPDVSLLPPEQLASHWREHGQAEGRIPSWNAFLAARPEFAAAIPPDFSVAGYRLNNPDLDHLSADWEFIRHYVDYGRAEGRHDKVAIDSFVAEIYFDELPPDDRALQALIERERAAGGLCTDIEQVLRRGGIENSALLSRLDRAHYRLCFPHLRNAAPGRIVRHFAEEGREAMAPLAVDLAFDHAFYTELDPVCAELDAPEAYLRWLNRGLPDGLAPNPRMFLRALGLADATAMPPGFDPALYRAANPDIAHLSRWDALAHAVRHGIAERRPGCPLGRATIDLHVAAADRLALAGDDAGAEAIFARVLTLNPGHVTALRHHADSLFRQGKMFEAARTYQMAIRLGKDSIWSHLNLASCYEGLDERALALEVVAALARRHPGDHTLRRRRDALADACFASSEAQAAWLAERKLFTRAVDTLGAAALLVADAAREEASAPQNPPEIRAGRHAVRRVSMLAEMSLPQCRFYRVAQKVEQFEHAGIAVDVFDVARDVRGFVESLAFADAALFYRVPAVPHVTRAILAAREAGLPTFYDVDDPIFDRAIFPDTQESYGGLVGDAEYGGLVSGTALFKAAAELCDHGIASTDALADRLARLTRGRDAAVHANALSQLLLGIEPAPPRARFPVRIFYGTGTKGHNEDFETYAAPALALLLARTPSPIELVVVGHLSLPPVFAAHASRIVRVPPCWDVASYWRMLSAADINIAVLKPGDLADCKSEIKWMEAARFGIPTVATATDTFRRVIRDGETGVLATSAAEWRASLERLVHDEAARTRIGEAARSEVLARYAPEEASARLARIVGAGRAVETERARVRVLIVNVFFPPQAIGGATRVVADNVRDLIARHGDDVEIEVVTTTEGGDEPYAVRVHHALGVRVTAITAGDAPDIDRSPEDPRMEEIFGRILDRVRPDLVHVHCIQRMTASICAAARARAIPYLITLHDGWWISDHQFLLDEEGALSLYDYTDPIAQARRGAAASARAGRLLPHLRGAAGLFAVSEPFAALHRRAGLERVGVIENGLPALTPVTRAAAPPGAARLTYAGGCCGYKGYDLLRAVLMRGRFARLRLTVIDHAMAPGIETRDVWGATPVTHRGKLPQAEIGALYAATDVLVAPSLWPESYGLVAREALAAGCWVVASDRGAVGTDVDATNGFVVDVGGLDGLAAALEAIDRDPHRYHAPPPPRALRSCVAQADDLAGIYATFRKPDRRRRRR